MRTRRLGCLDVSVVGVGCNNFGRQLDLDATRRCIHAALDHGITLIDTADSYGVPKTTSESFVGECLAGRRDEVILATKFGRVLDDERRGASPAYVRAATEASLRRLRTDRIDLMQLHIPDPATPIEDTLGALGELIAEGKVREIGASNFDGARLRAAADAAVRAGLRPFASTQADYSLLSRGAEGDVLAECERLGVSFLPFHPLFNGLLTGKYRPGEPPPAASRIGAKSEAAQAAIFSDRNMGIVAALTDYAQARGRTLLELAYAWLLSHEAIPSIIAGVSSPAQVASNVAAAGWILTSAERAEIDALAPAAIGEG